ncbi:TPA: tryptophan--tRNA ligase [Candidatus Peregrinibacteria bacterium]|nr:tryptophan--tRNA ligase [Candidatus Peregrinibacteria bacterium]
MKRILSGVQPSGKIHLGNYLGAIRQHIEMQSKFECFLFIADLHALTTVRDAKIMRENTLNLALDYLALGLDPEKTVFFKQSDVPEHSELAWIFDCITPMGFLERAHAWKDAQAKGKKDTTVGLFNYPVLMAADILLYQPNVIPVGQDQKQHVEISRDTALNFNKHFGETFKLPEPYIKENVATVRGTDGVNKMSKSYGNVIEIFAEEKTLQKQVMSIVTDSTPVESPKDPKKCTIFHLYEYIATPTEIANLKKKYEAGNFGYGDAKKELLKKLLEYFGPARKKRIELQKDLRYVSEVLKTGAIKAKKIASATMAKVKQKTGLGPEA